MNKEELLIKLKKPLIIVIINLLLISIILVAGWQSFNSTEKATIEEFNKRQLILAKGTTSGIEIYFANLAGDMETLGRIPEVHHFEEATTRRQLQQFYEELEPWGVNDIGVLDADGVLQYNVMAPQIEHLDFSWRKYFQEAKEMTPNDATYIIDFIEFKGANAGQMGVLLATPMFDTFKDGNHQYVQGEFVGVVFSTINLDTITQRFVAPVKSSENGHAFLIDQEYNIMWSPDPSLFGKNLLEESERFPEFQQVVKHLGDQISGKFKYTYYKFDESTGKYNTEETEEILLAHTHIQIGKETWGLGVWAPKDDADKLLHSTYLRLIILVGLAILIIFLGSSYAIVLSSNITKMLEEEVKNKTLDLRKTHSDLEFRVEARTAELKITNKDLEKQFTERKKADEALLEARDRAEKYLNVAEVMFIALNVDGEITLINRKGCRILGYKEEALIGKNFFEICLSKPVKENAWSVFQILLTGDIGPVEYYENPVLTKSGEERLIAWHHSLLTDDAGKIFGVLSSGEDITEYKRAEVALKESEEKFRTLAEKSPNMIFINKGGRIVFANEKCEEVMGYTKEEFYSPDFDFLTLIAEEYRGLVMDNFRKRMEGIELPPYEYTLVTKKGKRIEALQTNRLIKFEGETAIIGIITDITERKRTEEEMKRRLMKYKLEDGSLYLVQEPIPTVSINALEDLIKVGYKGFVISRTPPEKDENEKGIDAEFLWISEKGGEKTLPPNLKEIELKIENLSIGSAVFIERLDYLAFKNSFKKTLTFVQRLREIAYLRRHIIILSIDPDTFSNREIRLLEKETTEVEAQQKATLPEDLLETLRFIYRQNSIGAKPSHTEVGNELNISKPTVRKRIKRLSSAGYLLERGLGRRKVLDLTERGRNLFSK